MLDQLIQDQPQFEAKGLALAAITQGKPGEAKLFCQQRAPTIACLADPERNAYRAYGIGKLNFFSIFSKGAREARAKAGARGHTAEMPPRGQDALQLPATFVIGREGRTLFAHYYRFSGDHPSLELIFKSL